MIISRSVTDQLTLTEITVFSIPLKTGYIIHSNTPSLNRGIPHDHPEYIIQTSGTHLHRPVLLFHASPPDRQTTDRSHANPGHGYLQNDLYPMGHDQYRCITGRRDPISALGLAQRPL